MNRRKGLNLKQPSYDGGVSVSNLKSIGQSAFVRPRKMKYYKLTNVSAFEDSQAKMVHPR